MRIFIYLILAIACLAGCTASSDKEEAKDTEKPVETTDTTAVLIMQLQRCSKLYTAEYDIHKIITHSDEKRLKGKLLNHEFNVKMPLGDRKIAIPILVKLKAYIDFANFSKENIRREGDKIEILLPDPQVAVTSSSVDHEEIREYVDITRSRFSDAELSDYERQGREAVIKAIPETGIFSTARDNAAQLIIPMIVKMGYDEKNITITFRKDHQWKVLSTKD